MREIERRVQKMEAQDLSGLDLPDVPVATNFDQRLNLMFDMIALAYQANLTRVFSFMMAGEGSNTPYNHIGVPDAFHPLSHHQNDKVRKDRLVQDPDLPRAGVRQVPGQAVGDARRRRARCWTTRSCCTAATCRTATRTTSSRCRRSWWAAAPGGSRAASTSSIQDRTPLANLLLTLLDRAGVPEKTLGNSTRIFSEV